jgi:hypothetical protein
MRKKPVQERSSGGGDDHGPAEWVDQELGGTVFADERLGKRFRALLEQLSRSPGDSIPLVCQDWANTKAAYRFLDNDRVNEADILAGHFEATAGAPRRQTGLGWYCTTPRNSAINGTISRRSARRASILPVCTETARHGITPLAAF